MSVRINVGATFNARDLQRAQRELRALERQVTTLSGRMAAFGTQLQRVGSTMSRTGRTLTRNITTPLAALGGYAVKSALDFESSFARIEGLVGVAGDDIAELQEAARRLGPQYGRSATEAAEALFYITSAGLRGTEAIETLEASLKAAVVGLGDTQVVADLATSAMNAYGSANLSAADATDVLTNAVRLGKLEPSELAGAMGQVLPVASAMGVEFTEVGAAFAAMSRTGTNAEVAATQLRQIMATILSPTAEAAEAMQSVGLSAEGLRRQIRERGLLSVLQTLVQRFDGNTAATAEVFGNIRALSGVLDLMGSNASATEQIFRDMARSTGVLDEAFGVASDTAGQQFRVALAELQAELLELGQELLPFVQDVVEELSGLVDAFGNLSDAQQDMAVKGAALLAVLGPLGIALGGVANIVGLLARALPAIATAFAAIGSAVAFLAGAPLVALAAGIAAVVGVGYLLVRSNDDVAASTGVVAEEQRFAAMAAEERRKREERLARQQGYSAAQSEAMARAADLQAEAYGNVDLSLEGLNDETAAAGPLVVRLTRGMRSLLQEVNATNVGLGDAEQLVAEYARNLLAAGAITEDTARQVEDLARTVRADLDRALDDGRRRLEDARREFGLYRDAIAAGVREGNTFGDAVRSQADALDALSRAEADYADAQASGDPDRLAEAAAALADAEREQGTFLEFLGQGVTVAEGFAAQIETLVSAGASMQVVQEIAELGARTGGRVAAELLAGGAAAIEQANRLVEAVERASARAGEVAANKFYASGIAAAEAFIDAVEARIPELQATLDRIASMVEAATGTRPNVSLTERRDRAGTVVVAPPPAPAAAPKSREPDYSLKPSWVSRAEWDAMHNLAPFGTGFRAMAEGGLVLGPTLALIGEAGPEAVVPLDRMGDGTTVVNVTVTSADPAAVVDAIRRYTRRNGPLGASVRL